MKNRELNIFLQQQNAKLLETIDRLNHTVANLTEELSALKQAVLDKDKTVQQYK